MKPVVAVVGRPNVGKSTFFNKVAGRRISIIEDTPGVTRDRIYVDAEWCGRDFTLIDTGGIEPGSDDVILEQMKAQAELAIDMADVIVFMVNVKDGMTLLIKTLRLCFRNAARLLYWWLIRWTTPVIRQWKYTSFITLVLETPGRFHPFMVWASEIC